MRRVIDPAKIWANLPEKWLWDKPKPYGPDGVTLIHSNGSNTMIISAADWDDGVEYIHASIADTLQTPSYDDLVKLHKTAFGDGYAYQVFAPRDQHVNIHEHALHLWGRADGQPVLPEFGAMGTI